MFSTPLLPHASGSSGGWGAFLDGPAATGTGLNASETAPVTSRACPGCECPPAKGRSAQSQLIPVGRVARLDLWADGSAEPRRCPRSPQPSHGHRLALPTVVRVRAVRARAPAGGGRREAGGGRRCIGACARALQSLRGAAITWGGRCARFRGRAGRRAGHSSGSGRVRRGQARPVLTRPSPARYGRGDFRGTVASRDLELRGSGVGPWLNRPRGQPGGASPGALRCGARLPELRRWERDGTSRALGAAGSGPAWAQCAFPVARGGRSSAGRGAACGCGAWAAHGVPGGAGGMGRKGLCRAPEAVTRCRAVGVGPLSWLLPYVQLSV